MKIGIVTWKIENTVLGVTLPYVEYFETFGEVVLLKHDEEVRTDIDLVVLPGGPDVNPKRYNKKPHPRTGKPCLQREHFDLHVLPKYIELNTPIFGICRGMQSLAVHFGAELEQHMHHETNAADNRVRTVHNIVYRESKKDLYTIDPINSIHHQVVLEKNLPKELKIIGRHLGFKTVDKGKADTNGRIEALVHRTLPIAMVQYHPEELMVNSLADSLVDALLYAPETVNNLYKEIYAGTKLQSPRPVKKS